ncbi:uncharacterized protein M6B38_285105 [Iris pallida]|uniref:Uncharacterized protein n=1 Tax=Iris pallida TaxID=29817 RepID=A0AAX6I2Y8_IRIPA|nr:uncharacterized protein M6B38_285105 [Iris pallida]
MHGSKRGGRPGRRRQVPPPPGRPPRCRPGSRTRPRRRRILRREAGCGGPSRRLGQESHVHQLLDPELNLNGNNKLAPSANYWDRAINWNLFPLIKGSEKEKSE